MKLTVLAAPLVLLFNGAGTVAADPAPSAARADGLSQFTPRPKAQGPRLDYTVLDQALGSFVLRMGRSLREGAPRPDAALGSRIAYGHDSRYRLEGNRVGFGHIEPEAIASLTEYRIDLQRTAESVDIAGLPRNEQLAFWINLHNVAVIEQIALAYPVSQPSAIRLAGSNVSLDETPFITVGGVNLSPRDIRTRIVFANWRDPRVIYAFFRGEIGGPSIQPRAFTGADVDAMLGNAASEFVNSLRGTQKSGEGLLVSEIYQEAQPFFFPNWTADLKAHLLKHSEPEVAAIVVPAQTIEARIYDRDIADLSKGRPDPGYHTIYSDGTAQRTRVSADVLRLLAERQDKYEKILRGGDRTGTVTILEFPEEEAAPKVVE